MGKTSTAKNNLPSSLMLWRASWRLLWGNRRLIFGVVLVSVTINLILSLTSAGETTLAYQSLWFVFTSSALIWTVRHAADTKAKPSARRAYYEGTAPVLKLTLIFMVLSLSLLPFSLGAFLYSAVGVVSGGDLSIWEQALSISLWSVMALLSVYLLGRFISALYIVSLPNIWPLPALRASWRLTKGRSLITTSRLLVAIIHMVVVILLLSLALAALNISGAWAVAAQTVLTNGLVMPLLLTYAFIFYGYLK